MPLYLSTLRSQVLYFAGNLKQRAKPHTSSNTTNLQLGGEYNVHAWHSPKLLRRVSDYNLYQSQHHYDKVGVLASIFRSRTHPSLSHSPSSNTLTISPTLTLVLTLALVPTFTLVQHPRWSQHSIHFVTRCALRTKCLSIRAKS